MFLHLSDFIYQFYNRQVTLYDLSEVEKLIREAVEKELKDAADPWTYMMKLEKPSAIDTAERAFSLAQRIIERYPQNSIALRIAGRAALLSGNVDESISLFSSAARIDPESTTTWFELGLAYFSMIPDILQIPHSSDEVPVLLQTIASEGKSHQKGRYWSLYNVFNEDDWWLPRKPAKRRTLLSSDVVVKASLPDKDMALVFWIAAPSESESYRVIITNTSNNITASYRYTSEHSLAWQPTFVNLSKWRNSEILITLSADQPIGWGDISFVEMEEVACEITDCDERAVLAWQRGGFLQRDFMGAANIAFDQGNYQLSLIWYKRLLIFNSQSSDTWYFIGRSFTAQGHADDALRSYQLALKLNNFSIIGMSSVYCYMAETYRYATQPPQHEIAWELYQRAIRISDFRNHHDASHCHHRVGEIYWWSGNMDQAIDYFKQAIVFDAQYPWPYLFLARAYYKRDNNPDVVEQYILKSIELYRDNPWAYFELGELYYSLGRFAEAKEMYERTIQLDNEFAPALDMLRKMSVVYP